MGTLLAAGELALFGPVAGGIVLALMGALHLWSWSRRR